MPKEAKSGILYSWYIQFGWNNQVSGYRYAGQSDRLHKDIQMLTKDSIESTDWRGRWQFDLILVLEHWNTEMSHLVLWRVPCFKKSYNNIWLSKERENKSEF